MVVGYARASSKMSIRCKAELLNYGCEAIIIENDHRVTVTPVQLNKLLTKLYNDDILVTNSFFSLTTYSNHFLELMSVLEAKRINLVSIKENLDTRQTPINEFKSFFEKVVDVLYDTQKELLKEAIDEGILIAQIRGKKTGRPKGLSESAEKKAALAKKLFLQGNLTVEQIANQLGLSRTTCYRYIGYIRDRF